MGTRKAPLGSKTPFKLVKSSRGASNLTSRQGMGGRKGTKFAARYSSETDLVGRAGELYALAGSGNVLRGWCHEY